MITARRWRAMVAARRENSAFSSGGAEGSCSSEGDSGVVVLTERLLVNGVYEYP